MFVALKHRFLAIIATALLGVIAVTLLRGTIAVDQAAIRALILVVVVACIDRCVMPFVMLAIGGAPQQTAAPVPADTFNSRPSDT